MRSMVILGAAALIAAAVPVGSAEAQGRVVNPGPQAMGPGGGGGGPAFRGGGGWRGGGAWAGRGWRGGPRYGHWRGGPRYGYYRYPRRYYGPGPFYGGLAAGALLGGLLAAPPVYAEPPVVAVDPEYQAAIEECDRRYRTYDRRTQTYFIRPGVRARCP